MGQVRSYRKASGIEVTTHERRDRSARPNRNVDDGKARHAAATAAALEEPHDSGDRRSEYTADEIRWLIETALDRPGVEDYFATQDALIQDAGAADPVITSEQLSRLIYEHFDGDVRVYAIRHPNAHAEQLAFVAADESEPLVIRREAQQARGGLMQRCDGSAGESSSPSGSSSAVPATSSS